MKTYVLVLLILFTASIAFAQTPTDALPQDSAKLEILSAPKPFYPMNVDPKAEHEQVVVKLSVTEQGEVESAEVLSGAPALTDAALKAVKEWKFKPFIRDGKPIKVSTKLPVEFRVNRVRISQGVAEGLVIHKVPPTYPPLAREAGIRGSVVLHAVIGIDGSVKELNVVIGHPMLTPAAIDAVKHWKYKPYYLNGIPMEVDTQVTINFTLGYR